MSRRSIASRFLALALMLSPALALAAPAAGHDHPAKDCTSCECTKKMSPSGDHAAARSSATGSQQAQPTDSRLINNTVDGSFGP